MKIFKKILKKIFKKKKVAETTKTKVIPGKDRFKHLRNKI